MDEAVIFPEIDVRIEELEREWDRLDASGTGSVRQQEITREIERLKKIKEPRKQLNPHSAEVQSKWQDIYKAIK